MWQSGSQVMPQRIVLDPSESLAKSCPDFMEVYDSALSSILVDGGHHAW